MVNLVAGWLVAMASIVLTTEIVEQALPMGTPKETVEAYLTDIGAERVWRPRGRNDSAVRSFPWKDEDIGVLTGIVREVRTRWWLPSFGKVIIVHIGISADGTVSGLDFQEYLGGAWS